MRWQLRFDGGRQQRYLPDRRRALHYVLELGPQAREPRFELWAEGEPVRMADGSDGGRRFELVEVLDLTDPAAAERVRAELATDPARPPTARGESP